MSRVFVQGTITSMGLGGGHRLVIGRWPQSPIGPLVDAMWATPENERVLLVGSQEGADFISSIYEFDSVRVGPLTVTGDTTITQMEGHGFVVEVVGGRRRPVPFPRPLAVTRYIEAPIARALMGVEAVGVSPKGVREWYQTRGWSWIVGGTGTLDGRDLGGPRRLERPVGVGFSEPPLNPSIVSVKVTIEWCQ